MRWMDFCAVLGIRPVSEACTWVYPRIWTGDLPSTRTLGIFYQGTSAVAAVMEWNYGIHLAKSCTGFVPSTRSASAVATRRDLELSVSGCGIMIVKVRVLPLMWHTCIHFLWRDLKRPPWSWLEQIGASQYCYWLTFSEPVEYGIVLDVFVYDSAILIIWLK